MKKYLYMMISLIVLASVLVACGGGANDQKDEGKEQTTENADKTNEEAIEEEQVTPTGNNPIVTMTMENGGEVQIELYPEIAPNTVNNFISLVEDGFYDGLIFHRVIPGFMIQGGDPEGTGMGGPGYAIKGEFSSNDFENNLEHDRGVLSMARTMEPDSAGSQFFIMTDPSPHL
ncbi:MAG TPA: peptidylprolyl isomerase, partial [Bacteroidales bacterium]|nr:peptidylprolyl isomerase [Bacteroidales bacterium]